jgi:hypothetical protein
MTLRDFNKKKEQLAAEVKRTRNSGNMRYGFDNEMNVDDGESSGEDKDGDYDSESSSDEDQAAVDNSMAGDENDIVEDEEDVLPCELTNNIEGDEAKYLSFRNGMRLRFRSSSTFDNPLFDLLLTKPMQDNEKLVSFGGMITRNEDDDSVRVRFEQFSRSGRRFAFALARSIAKTKDEHDRLCHSSQQLHIPATIIMDGIDISQYIHSGGIGFFAQHSCAKHATTVLKWDTINIVVNGGANLPYLRCSRGLSKASLSNPTCITVNRHPNKKGSKGCNACKDTKCTVKVESAPRYPLDKIIDETAGISPSDMKKLTEIRMDYDLTLMRLRLTRDRRKSFGYLMVKDFVSDWKKYYNCCGYSYMCIIPQNAGLTIQELQQLWMVSPCSVYTNRITFCGTLSQTDVKQKVIDFLLPYRGIGIPYGNRFKCERIYSFPDDTCKQKFCSKCTAFLLGVKASTFSSYARDVRTKQQVRAVHSNSKKISSRSSMHHEIIREMINIDIALGQPAPNKAKRYLPYVSPADLAVVVSQRLHRDVEASLVKRILKTDPRFANVECNGEIRVNGFMRCTVCDGYTKQLQETSVPAEISEVEENKKNHLYQIETDRTVYYKHNRKALLYPNRYASLNYDGFDQKKTELPHTIGKKTHEAANRMEIHVAGIVSRGFAQPLLLYLADPHFTNCGNMTATIVKDCFEKQYDFGQFEASQRKQLIQKEKALIADKTKQLGTLFAEPVEIRPDVVENADQQVKCVICGVASKCIKEDIDHQHALHKEVLEVVRLNDGQRMRCPVIEPNRLGIFQSLFMLESKLLVSENDQWLHFYQTFLQELQVAEQKQDTKINGNRYSQELLDLLNKHSPSETSLQFYSDWKKTPIRVFSSVDFETHVQLVLRTSGSCIIIIFH